MKKTFLEKSNKPVVFVLLITGLLSILCILTACGPSYKTSYEYVPPNSMKGKMCVNRCLSAKRMCQQSCREEQGECEKQARQNARFQYRSYVAERRHKNLPIERNLDSFYNDFDCRTRACGCDNDYRFCYANCGGDVIEHRECVSNCDKVPMAEQ